MANPASHASGTQACTVGSENSLTTVTVAATFVIEVDLTNLTTNDVLELYIRQKLLTSGTQRGVDMMQWAGAQPTAQLIWESDPYPNVNTDAASVEFVLKQTFGTSRNIPWQVFKFT